MDLFADALQTRDFGGLLGRRFFAFHVELVDIVIDVVVDQGHGFDAFGIYFLQ